MTTSGTFNYDPSLGELTLYAFHLCGIRATELTQEHMFTARHAANMMQANWSARGVNLWTVDQQAVPLVAGQSTYSVPPETIAMLDAYITTTAGAIETDRIILPFSRSEYASIANKQSAGFPTSFWFDRLLAPTVTLWPVPDGNQVNLVYYRTRQIQDAVLSNAASPEIPFYFLEPYVNGHARRLAMSWAKDRVEGLKALEDEAWAIAADQNVETSNVYVSPMLGGYFRP